MKSHALKKELQPLDVQTLWRLQRVGAPSLSPDGARAVCAVTRFDMGSNQSHSALWLLPTGASPDHAQGHGPVARQLTACGSKDGQPAWCPTGEHIAFIAKRQHGDSKDATPQLYTIAADGGEAQRRSNFAPGVDAFKWLPDGSGIVFSAWVWPGLKGAVAQDKAHKAHTDRQESGYATSEAFYRYWDRNLPQGRVLHLLLLELKGARAGRITDLFEGTALELPRTGGSNSSFDVHPSGRWVAFEHDPAAVPLLGNRTVVSEIEIKSRKLAPLAQHKAWDIGAPSYSPDGEQVAVVAAHVAAHHTAPAQLAVVPRGKAFTPKAVLAPDWDHEVNAPLRWEADGQSLLFTAEDRGRCHLWRCALVGSAPAAVVSGGWVQGFAAAAGMLVTLADSSAHPARLHAYGSGSAAQRIERFNDAELAGVALGPVEEVQFKGAQGDAVQMWLTYPVGFDKGDGRRKHPLLHVIHGGPHAAAGDTFSYRWNAHVLASQGHVVAQVNFHGSSGFGFAFKHSLVGRQGELELQDIEAGTDWLLAQPWADAERVFASGGSYGGFLVAWMNGHVAPAPAKKGARKAVDKAAHPRYRAYVCHAGVYDRVATFSADSYSVRPKDLAANYWQDMPRVLAQSPHAAAAQMRTPTLVIHGAQDFRVPDCNGLAYYNTLKALGVDARLLWFADENHWVLKPRNSAQWYGEFLGWLQRHDVPQRALAGRALKAPRASQAAA